MTERQQVPGELYNLGLIGVGDNDGASAEDLSKSDLDQ